VEDDGAHFVDHNPRLPALALSPLLIRVVRTTYARTSADLPYRAPFVISFPLDPMPLSKWLRSPPWLMLVIGWIIFRWAIARIMDGM
jgi:hypothetical protein